MGESSIVILTPSIPPEAGGFFIRPQPFYTSPKFLLSILGVAILLGLVFKLTSTPPPLESTVFPIPNEPIIEAVELPTTVIVEIKGAVLKPGIYELPIGSRLFELIDRAGGLLPESDDIQINQASLLTDEQSVYIPTEGEVIELASSESSFININTADATLLQTLPGIGPAKASAIIAYREKTPFTKPEDINAVDGIGDKTLEQLLPLISVK